MSSPAKGGPYKKSAERQKNTPAKNRNCMVQSPETNSFDLLQAIQWINHRGEWTIEAAIWFPRVPKEVQKYVLVTPEAIEKQRKSIPEASNIYQSCAQERSESDPGGKSVPRMPNTDVGSDVQDAFIQPFGATPTIRGSILGAT